MQRVRVGLALVTIVTLSGCIGIHVPGPPGRGHGPPPHAPAHGHRQQHADAELRFDADLGVYVVVGHSDLFYFDGRYLRFQAGGWQVSANMDGPWNAQSEKSVPPGLRAKHPGKGNGRGKPSHAKGKSGKGSPGPAKGRW